MASVTHGEASTEQKSPGKKFSQSRLFEFLPNTEITPEQVVELTSIIRIGVSGEKISLMSSGLQKFFIEIKK